jgi:hypothetical protein
MPLTFIEGNGSTRKLSERSRLKIFVRLAKLFGTVPENWFFERSNVSSALNFPRKSGILPESELCPNSRYLRFEYRDEIETGIFPENLFRESSRAIRFVKEVKISGMLPLSWFPWRPRYVRFLRFLMDSGNVPVRKLLPSFN